MTLMNEAAKSNELMDALNERHGILCMVQPQFNVYRVDIGEWHCWITRDLLMEEDTEKLVEKITGWREEYDKQQTQG